MTLSRRAAAADVDETTFSAALSPTSPSAGGSRRSGRFASLLALALGLTVSAATPDPAAAAARSHAQAKRTHRAQPPHAAKATRAARRLHRAAAPGTAARAVRGGSQRQIGLASYYSSRFHGRRMADGTRLDNNSDSAASRTLPFGTVARVTNLANGRSATVTIRDRGPHGRGRIIDVSQGVARRLGMIRSGVTRVEVTILSRPAAGAGTVRGHRRGRR